MMMVAKEWGSEIWVCNNDLYCMKFLRVEAGYQCSLHRHLVKDETFFVQEGAITLEFGNETRYLQAGDSQRISPGTWHRFSNKEKEFTGIIEVSTHHSDEDVERREPSRHL